MKHPIILSAILLVAGQLLAAEKIGTPDAKPLPDPQGIHNFYLLGTNVYSGSAPEGDAGFAALAKYGIKTIISVDGAKPDVTLAKKFRMRYVHLPHGYDGISTNVQLALAKAAEVLDAPFYIHCHHGEHRGPAAAAVLCMAKDGWDAEQAEQWLTAAGTSTNYAGLYETVRQFKKPDPQQLKCFDAEFPEVAKVSGLVDAMVAIDHTWENLKQTRAAGYQPPGHHPDMNPANEALILSEHYRETRRLPDTARQGTDFLVRLEKAEAEVKQTETLLRDFRASSTPEFRARLDASFEVIGRTCASCHKQYRNQRPDLVSN